MFPIASAFYAGLPRCCERGNAIIISIEIVQGFGPVAFVLPYRYVARPCPFFPQIPLPIQHPVSRSSLMVA